MMANDVQAKKSVGLLCGLGEAAPQGIVEARNEPFISVEDLKIGAGCPAPCAICCGNTDA